MLRSARLTCLTVFALFVGLLPATALACDATYVVRPGDTLASIAAQKLGSGNRFRELYELNQGVIGPDPNLVKTGTRLVLPCANGSQPERTVAWNPLPKPRDMAVAVRGGAVQVVDIRSPKAVAAGVIPGALSMPLAAWRGPRENPGRVPPVEVLAELIGGAGLRLDRPILIVGSSEEPPSMGGAAFVYWMLKSLGAKRIAILEGGHKAWVEENLPLSNRARRGRPYTPRLTFSEQWLADRNMVDAISQGRMAGALIDSRPMSMIERRDTGGQSVATTIPGALAGPAPRPHRARIASTSPEEGAVAVLDQLKSFPVMWEAEQVVTFCASGPLGALNWFYASEVAGIENVKLYPESVTGWLADGGVLAAPATQEY